MHLSTLGFLAVLVLAARHPAASGAQTTLLVCALGAIGLIMLGGVAVYVWPIPLIMQLELVRAGFFVPLMALPALANYIVTAVQQGEVGKRSAVLLALTDIVSPFGSFTALALFVNRFSPKRFVIRLLPLVAVPVLMSSGYFFATRHIVSRNWLVSPPKNAWTEAAAWARGNTPKDALFVVPVHLDIAELGADFRSIAQRSVVVNRFDGDMSVLNYEYAFQWYKRMQDLTAGEFSVGIPGSSITRAIRKGSESLSEADVLALAKKYGAGYVLRERSAPLALSPVFEDEQFLVYQVQ